MKIKRTMKNVLKISFTILMFLSCSPKDKEDNVDKIESKRYEIVTENNGKISGFSFKDDSDTMRLGYTSRSTHSTNNFYNIIIDNETKIKIKEVFRYHLDIDNFNSSQKNTEEIGTVTFKLSSSTELIAPSFPNTITIEFKNISKNNDVSNKYQELISYLKSRYKQFQKWSN